MRGDEVVAAARTAPRAAARSSAADGARNARKGLRPELLLRRRNRSTAQSAVVTNALAAASSGALGENIANKVDDIHCRDVRRARVVDRAHLPGVALAHLFVGRYRASIVDHRSVLKELRRERSRVRVGEGGTNAHLPALFRGAKGG